MPRRKAIPCHLLLRGGGQHHPGRMAPLSLPAQPPGTVQPRAPHTPFLLPGPVSQASPLLLGLPLPWFWWLTTHLRMLEATVRRKSSERTPRPRPLCLRRGPGTSASTSCPQPRCPTACSGLPSCPHSIGGGGSLCPRPHLQPGPSPSCSSADGSLIHPPAHPLPTLLCSPHPHPGPRPWRPLCLSSFLLPVPSAPQQRTEAPCRHSRTLPIPGASLDLPGHAGFHRGALHTHLARKAALGPADPGLGLAWL